MNRPVKWRAAQLLAAAMVFGISAAASGDIRVPGSGGAAEQARPPGLAFDGVWVGPAYGNVTLVKELKDTVVLQGKDNQSTWSARGIKSGKSLVCRGSGITNDGVEFVYESTITAKDGAPGELEDAWAATFPNGEVLRGKDVLKRLNLGDGERASAPEISR